jgi:hypothetical protein
MKRRQLLKRSNNALKAIDGTLKSSGLPLCCGCGMELDVNTVNPKWEEVLVMQHDLYREAGTAWVVKTNPSMRIVKGKPFFAAKAAPDFIGIIAPGVLDPSCGPMMVVFDAKSTLEESWSYALLELHQAKDLESVMLKGGLAFLVIELPVGRFLAMWKDIRASWWVWLESYRPGSRAPMPRLFKNDLMFAIKDGTNWIHTLKRIMY